MSIGSSFYYFEMIQNNDKQLTRSSDRAVILLMPFINNSGKEDNNYIGKGNYEHKNDASLEKGHTSTEQFAKLTNIFGTYYL